MKCKTGDLAVVIGYRDPAQRHTLGSIITVTTLTVTGLKKAAAWRYKGDVILASGRRAVAIPDEWLQPIRPAPQAKTHTVAREKETT